MIKARISQKMDTTQYLAKKKKTFVNGLTRALPTTWYQVRTYLVCILYSQPLLCERTLRAVCNAGADRYNDRN